MRTFSLPLALAALSLATAACSTDDPASTGDTDSSTGGSTDTDPSGNPTSSPTSEPTTEPTDTVDPDTTVGPTTDSETDTDTTTGPGDVAQIRVVHAAPEAPNVDIYVAGSTDPVITDLAYGEASDYLEVPAGTYDFEVRAAGAPAEDAPVYSTGDLDLPAGATVTAVAAGLIGSDEADEAFRVLPLVEGFEDAGAGNAAVRIVHAGADAPSVDINVGNDGGDPELPGVARFADSGAAGVPLPSGAALQVGIEAGGNVVTAFTTPELPEGANLFVIATGLLGDMPRAANGFGLLAVGPDGVIGLIPQNPFVHAFHAGADAPAVDICTGDTHLVVGAEFGDLANIQVPPGSYDLEIHAAPADCTGDPVLTANSGDLVAGQHYLVAATGELQVDGGDPPGHNLTLAAFGEDFDLEAAPNAVFRIVHLATATAVNVGTVNGDGDLEEATLLAADLEWPNASAEISVPAGNYDVGVLEAADSLPNAPDYEVTAPLSDGLRVFALASGDYTPNGGDEPFGVTAVVTGPGAWAAIGL
ncbi:MAG: DUF4397 domain-containing protein [Myxococcales bacterium]|nr:DUF4397 domain-containing protein [Myxococcales bacterium]